MIKGCIVKLNYMGDELKKQVWDTLNANMEEMQGALNSTIDPLA